MKKDTFDKLRDFAINTNADVISKAATSFEKVVKVELPDIFKDGEKLKETSRKVFSDESLLNFKKQTEEIIEKSRKQIEDSGWTTPQTFRQNLLWMMEDV